MQRWNMNNNNEKYFIFNFIVINNELPAQVLGLLILQAARTQTSMSEHLQVTSSQVKRSRLFMS